MKAFSLEKNPLNIQRCLLPDCDFLKNNYGRYCFISLSDANYKLLVKIGLHEIRSLEKVAYVDCSVLSYSTLWDVQKIKFLNSFDFGDFVVLNKPLVAKNIKVTIVFSDVFSVKRYNDSQNVVINIVRNVLKFYAFSNKSLLSLLNFDESQRFGINFIVVTSVGTPNNSHIYEIDSTTIIEVEKVTTQLKLDQIQIKTGLTQLGGCKNAYKTLKEAVCLSKTKGLEINKKILLAGPGGCGKSTLVRNLAFESNSVLLEMSASEINCSRTGDLKLRRLLNEAQIYVANNEFCIILLKNIDLLLDRKTKNAKRNLCQLIKFLNDMDSIQFGIIVIFTTKSLDDIDVELRKHKRFEDEVEIMVPTSDEREDILTKIFGHQRMMCNPSLVKLVAKWTAGFVGADLKLLVTEALLLLYKIQNSLMSENNALLEQCFKIALTKVIPCKLKGAVGLCRANDVSFSQLGGLNSIKKVLNLSVTLQLQNPNKFRQFGIPLTKGILLYGPPGCAKTTLVKALAKENGVTFISTSAADLYSPYVGDAEKKIVQLFTQARIGAPAIIFIDEIDAVVGNKSGDRERGVQERVLSTLLIEMDGIGLKVKREREDRCDGRDPENLSNHEGDGVVVIGATNHPHLLDDALRRPGRFDKLIYVPPPDQAERWQILKTLTKKMPLHESVDLTRLSELTEFYSGADLRSLCQESGIYALSITGMKAEEIHQFHFEHIIDGYKPSLNANTTVPYESFCVFNH